jgi:hypothetical protein
MRDCDTCFSICIAIVCLEGFYVMFILGLLPASRNVYVESYIYVLIELVSILNYISYISTSDINTANILLSYSL